MGCINCARRSDAKAIYGAIRSTIRAAEGRIVDAIKAGLVEAGQRATQP